MAEHACRTSTVPTRLPSARLKKRGLRTVSTNKNPDQCIALNSRDLWTAFGPELRRILSAAPAETPQVPTPSAPKPVQRSLPGHETAGTRAAFDRAGLAETTTYELAMADPAMRRCLEVMANNYSRSA